MKTTIAIPLFTMIMLVIASCQNQPNTQHVNTPLERDIMRRNREDSQKEAVPSHLQNEEATPHSDTKARLNAFWKLVSIAKKHEQIPNQLNSLIYEIIANRYPSLPYSEIMAKFETIDEDAALQDDILHLLYKNYAQGNYPLDKHNLNIVFDDLCHDGALGHWVADYVLDKYGDVSQSQPKKEPSKFKPNLHF